MTMLFIPESFLPKKGGAELYLFELLKRIRTDKALFLPSYLKFDASLLPGVKTVFYPSIDYGPNVPMLNCLSIFIYLPLTLLRQKSKLVHVYLLGYCGIVSVIVSKLFRKKVVISLRGSEVFISRKNKFFKFFQDLALKLSDKIIINSESMRDLLPKSDKIIFVSNAVDTTFFKPIRARKKYDIVLVANLRKIKGIDCFFNALKILCDKYSVALVGGGEVDKYKKLAKKMGLRKVKFVGFLEKESVRKLLNESKVFVLPSLSEGMPNSLLEAMSCGLSCAASRVGAIPDILCDFDNGLLVEPGNSLELAEKMKLLLTDVSLRKKLGRNARKTVVKHNSWKTILEGISCIHDSLLI